MNELFLIGFPSGSEWFIILLIVLLVFGGKKIPELKRGIGRGIREFQRAKHAMEEEIKEGMREADREGELPPEKSSDPSPTPAKGGAGK